MNITCAIVDDEQPAIEVLQTFIQRTPGLDLVYYSTDPLAALNALVAAPPMISFLDVDMPELSGLELAGLLDSRISIVFTTSYREFAVEAFERRAFDYLLKPVSYERFARCIQQFRSLPPLTAGKTPTAPSFFVKTGIRGQLTRVSIPDILYIEGADNYITIVTTQEKVMTYLSLKEIQEQLPGDSFVRIHKSHIVSTGAIQLVEPGQVRLKNHITLALGEAYREQFFRQISPFLLQKKNVR